MSLSRASDTCPFLEEGEGKPWVCVWETQGSVQMPPWPRPHLFSLLWLKDTGPGQEWGTGPQVGPRPLGAEVLSFSQTPNWEAADSRNLRHSWPGTMRPGGEGQGQLQLCWVGRTACGHRLTQETCQAGCGLSPYQSFHLQGAPRCSSPEAFSPCPGRTHPPLPHSFGITLSTSLSSGPVGPGLVCLP